MGSSREKEMVGGSQLSSLVVRPSDTDADYEPGEVRRDFPRSDLGYRNRAGSGSPVRRRYSPDFDRPVGMPRGRGYGGGRSPGRFRDYSPPYGRGRGRGGRFMGRGFHGARFGFGPYPDEGMMRSHTNVRPREGDWICPDPTCGNLNFARREHCNNCSRFRYAPVRHPRRGYFVPPAHGPHRRFPGPSFNRSPGRPFNGGYRSPPRHWDRDGPRDLGRGGPPHPRYEERFLDHHMRRERLDYPEEDYRERSKFGRPLPPDMEHRDRERPLSPDIRDRERDSIFEERKSYERRLPSPGALRRPLSPDDMRRPLSPDAMRRPLSPDDMRRPLSPDDMRRPLSPAALRRPLSPDAMRSPSPPPRRWDHDERERSRSPIRGVPPSKEYEREMYVERAREERRGRERDDDDDEY